MERKLLIVEDDPSMVTSYLRTLKGIEASSDAHRFDMTVREFLEDALALVASGSFDFAIIDLDVPTKSEEPAEALAGLRLANALAAAKIPFIVVSCHGSDQNALKELRKLKSLIVLEKSEVSPEALTRHLLSALDSAKQLTGLQRRVESAQVLSVAAGVVAAMFNLPASRGKQLLDKVKPDVREQVANDIVEAQESIANMSEQILALKVSLARLENEVNRTRNAVKEKLGIRDK